MLCSSGRPRPLSPRREFDCPMDEHDDPTYILDLIKKVTTVSIETMKIVDSL